MFLSFFLVAMVSHWNNWDPILEFVVRVWRSLCPPSPRQTVLAESLENESLLEAEQT